MKGVLETQKCSQSAPASCNERHQVSMARMLSLRRVPVAEVHRVLRWYRARYQGFNSVFCERRLLAGARDGSIPTRQTRRTESSQHGSRRHQ